MTAFVYCSTLHESPVLANQEQAQVFQGIYQKPDNGNLLSFVMSGVQSRLENMYLKFILSCFCFHSDCEHAVNSTGTVSATQCYAER